MHPNQPAQYLVEAEILSFHQHEIPPLSKLIVTRPDSERGHDATASILSKSLSRKRSAVSGASPATTFAWEPPRSAPRARTARGRPGSAPARRPRSLAPRDA